MALAAGELQSTLWWLQSQQSFWGYPSLPSDGQYGVDVLADVGWIHGRAKPAGDGGRLLQGS
jgi:hypothetical protein